VLLDGQLVSSGSYTQNVTFTGTVTYLYAHSPNASALPTFTIDGSDYIVTPGSTVTTSAISSGSKSVTITNSGPPTTWSNATGTIQAQGYGWTAYGNGIFIAGNMTTNSNYLAYSLDLGRSWTYATNPQGINYFLGGITFAANVNKFVYVSGNTGSNTFLTYNSTNGYTWTQVSTTINMTASTQISNVSYGNGYVVVQGGQSWAGFGNASQQTWRSSNGGGTFIENTTSHLANYKWTTLAYGLVNGTTPTWVAFNNDTSNGQASAPNYSTDNATNWVQAYAPATRSWIASAFGNGIFMVMDNYGYTVTSSNGITWTVVSTGTTYTAKPQYPNSLTFGSGYFVCGGPTASGNSGIYYTKDGKSWTLVGNYSGSYGNNTLYWLGIGYGSGTFIAMPNVGSVPLYASLSTSAYPVSFGIYNGPTTTY
jgi:hypothetical protein